MKIGDTSFEQSHHTYVMGILNVTPDSFSDGGMYDAKDQALLHVEQMIADGADMIDIGGESTRPGYQKISDEEEIDRVIPIIEDIKLRFNIPISLDTYKSKVARAGIDAGADMINDIWGLKADAQMGELVAKRGVAYCLIHNRKNPTEKFTAKQFIKEMQDDIQRALDSKIQHKNILLDPGVGFAKTQEANLIVMAHLSELKALGFPVLLGASRKSVIDYVLHLPINERLEGTLATTATAVMQEALFVRVHDVKENVRLIQMMEAILGRSTRIDGTDFYS